jgi:hypothetical protein
MLHTATNRTRLVMRKEKTTTILLNQLVQPEAELVAAKSENDGAGANASRAFVFEAEDYATGVLRKATFAIRFKGDAVAAEFSKAYTEAQSLNKRIFALEAASQRSSASSSSAAAPASSSTASTGAGAGAEAAAPSSAPSTSAADEAVRERGMRAGPTILEEGEDEDDDAASTKTDDMPAPAQPAPARQAAPVAAPAPVAPAAAEKRPVAQSSAPAPAPAKAAPVPAPAPAHAHAAHEPKQAVIELKDPQPAAAAKSSGGGGGILVPLLVVGAVAAGLVWADRQGHLEGVKKAVKELVDSATKAAKK